MGNTLFRGVVLAAEAYNTSFDLAQGLFFA